MQSQFALALAGVAEQLRNATPQSGDAEKSWRAGDLSYKMWAVQLKMAAVLESPISLQSSLKKVLNCSRRLRKTTTTLIKATELGLKKKNALIRFAAPTRDMLVTIIEPIMEMICSDAPEDLKPIWKASHHHYFFPGTGARLYVAGCDNLKAIGRLRGRAADLCVVDEAQEIKHLRYLIDDVLLPQLLGVKEPRGPLWILLTPPKTPVHECRDYVIEAKAQKCYAEFNIFASEYPPEVIEQFCKEAGGPESTTWLREYMCQFVVDKNYAIIPEWTDSLIEEYVPDEFYKFYAKYEGLDISGGKKHKTANLYAVYDFKKAKLCILDESVLSPQETTTRKLAETVKAKETELWKTQKPALRIADNNNLILLADLGKEHAVHFQPTSKDTLDAMVNNVRLWIGGKKLAISPKCEQLIGSLKYGVWTDNRKEWEESAVYGHFDALAALMYLLRYIDVVTNPIPVNYGTNPDSDFVNPGTNTLTENMKVLQTALLRRKR